MFWESKTPELRPPMRIYRGNDPDLIEFPIQKTGQYRIPDPNYCRTPFLTQKYPTFEPKSYNEMYKHMKLSFSVLWLHFLIN